LDVYIPVNKEQYHHGRDVQIRYCSGADGLSSGTLSLR
jgi:hypothetical protein